METTGRRIKKRRKELKLSVDQLADKLGKNRATVYRYESDEIENMPASVLNDLARVLKTTQAYLMGWEDNSGYLTKLNKKDNDKLDFDFDVNYRKWYMQKLVDSGIYDSYKKNINEYYKWYFDLNQKLTNIASNVENANEFMNVIDFPYCEFDKEYFSNISYDYTHIIKQQLTDLEEFNDCLDTLMLNEQKNNKPTQLYEIQDIRKFLEYYYIDKHDRTEFDSLSENEIKELYLELIKKLKLENDKFLTLIKTK